MSIQVALRHATRYRYDRSVKLGAQVVRLRPAPHCRTTILAYSLKVEPEQHFLNWQQDPQSNWLARIVVPEATEYLTVTVDLTAELNVINPFDFFLEPEAESYPFAYPTELMEDLKPYFRKAEGGAKFRDYLAAIPREEKQTTAFLFDLNAKLQSDISYLIRMEPGIQTPDQTLSRRAGSCRDSAWLLVQLLRHLGLAARFASGYLIQLKPDVKSLDGPSGAEQDFTDLHAWCEVYLPGAGWVGLDPTSGLFAGEGHIPLACAGNPTHAAPITGALEECDVSFEFDMSIARVVEPPRVTKPYTPEQWRSIDALGNKIDAMLADGDVRLTMGGEPTFVSIDDMDGVEWTTAAVGPTKRGLADTLIRRLRERFAPGGFLHYGQGKWYPGESLPRWAFALYWRGDGLPLWRDGERVARERDNYAPTLQDARNLVTGIARRLDIHPDHAMAAYEDPWHYISTERALPINLDPLGSKLDDPEMRARLARVFERGLSKPAGFVLPVQRWNAPDRRRWRSERWVTRTGRLQLMPGDSPVGLRLPMASLPWLPETARPYVPPPDPFDELPPLPDRDSYRQPYLSGEIRDPSWGARRKRVEQGPPMEGAAVRTALTIEPRDGRLCVFMPPTEDAADYLDLLSAVEDAAAEIDASIHVEGYVVMPGGLVRVAADDHARALSMQSGAVSKDAWVVGHGPVDTFSLLKQPGKPVQIRRIGEAPPSRAMDNLFWLGRYTERAENLIRVLRAIVLRLGDEPDFITDLAERFLTPFAQTNFSALRQGAVGDYLGLQSDLRALLYDRRFGEGLQPLLLRMRHAAWSARDRLSLDTWRTIQIFTEGETLRDRAFEPAEALSYLDALVRRAAAFSGLCAENMTRGPNWLFVDLGRRLERAAHLAWLVRHTAVAPPAFEAERVRIALEIADSAMTYRSRYLNAFQIAPLIDLLLLDESNPRAVVFQLAAIENNLSELPRITPVQRRDGAQRILSDLRATLANANSPTLASADDAGTYPALAEFVGVIETGMTSITDAITDAYFQHSVHRRIQAIRRETA